MIQPSDDRNGEGQGVDRRQEASANKQRWNTPSLKVIDLPDATLAGASGVTDGGIFS